MPAVSIMIKPASSMCNMRCKYCFYHSLASTRENYGYGIMNDATSLALIEKALKFADGESVYFAFQGGEPLLAGKRYFEYFTDTVKRLNTSNAVVHYALQTNGILIDDEWAKFLKRNNFLLGLSLDGDQNANRYRIDSESRYTFSRVTESAQVLNKYGVDYNILVVATGLTARHVEENYNWLKKQGFRFLQFIPCLRPFGDNSESLMYMDVAQYGDYLIRLFNLYVKDYVTGNYISIRELDNLVRLYLGGKSELCGMCGHCAHQFVIESNGNVYPCDFYCLDEWLLGNINNDELAAIAHSEKAVEFIKESFVIPDKCKSCDIFGICRAGGCKRRRADRDYCDAYKKFFGACLPLFRVFANEKV